MSKNGTCRHTFQIQEMWRIGSQPHERTRRVDSSEEYTCQYLDTIGALPPPVKRANGGLAIRPGDCDVCPRYEPAMPTKAPE